MALTEETISVRNGRFSVQVQRGGSGEPLVYLHGSNGPLTADRGGAFLEALSKRYTVIQPTHPGWGESTGLEQIDDVIDMALFYHDLFDALGLTSVNLIGHSLGGMFAAEIAALNGSYVRKLVLAAPVGLWMDDCIPMDMFSAPQEEVMRAAFVNPPALPVIDPEDRVAQAKAMLENEKARSSAAKFLWPIWDKGLKKRIHRIKAPTLLIWGEHDGLVPPAYGPEFQRLIPGSKLVTLAGSAHVPMSEQPEEFLAAVSDFLA
jgi:pimeloyl-ACP methyl ester carboxylesterase